MPVSSSIKSMNFISPDPKTLANALDGWQWIGLGNKKPMLVTAFADLFLTSSDGIWSLDTLEGKLKNICQTKEELDRILSTDEGNGLYLLSGFVERANQDGIVLNVDECYDFKLHPVVGGAIDFSNIEKRSFLVALHLRGQLHEQVRHFPDGAKISKFVLSEDKEKRPWWKIW